MSRKEPASPGDGKYCLEPWVLPSKFNIGLGRVVAEYGQVG